MEKVAFGENFLSKRIWEGLADIQRTVVSRVIVPDGMFIVVDVLDNSFVVTAYNLDYGWTMGNISIPLGDNRMSPELVGDIADTVNIELVRLELKHGGL